MRIRYLVSGLTLGFVFAASAHADSVVLGTSKDNTLFQDGTGGLSSGAGVYMFAGKAAGLRRALLAFDVAGSVPAGSTIQSATLTLYCSRTNYLVPSLTLELHRLLADWGEGASDAGDPGGTGTTAEPGDATWIHTFHNTAFWTTAGGDFDATLSGAQTLATTGSYAWGSTAQMVADVQGWLDNPATNFGWILLGGEDDENVNAKRLDTRENATPANRPVLEIEYLPPTVTVEASAWSRIKGLFR